MAKFNTGQSFADGDTVTGAKLNNITGLLDIYSGVIADQTAITATVSTADLLLIADTDAGSSGAANKVTVQKLLNDTLTNGTYTNAQLSGNLNVAQLSTLGTISSTRGTIGILNSTTGTITGLNTTTGTVATLNSTTGTVATLNSTTGTITGLNSTNGTVATLNSTTGTITNLTSTTGTVATLNSTTGTITNLSTTLAGDFTISQGTGTLGTSGVTLGTYGSVSAIPFLTVNAKGIITAATTGTFSTTPANGSITYAKLSTSSTEADNVASRTAKAWVNFNGTGTVAIRDDFNVSSITDNGTGNYTINYSADLPNANYAATGLMQLDAVTDDQNGTITIRRGVASPVTTASINVSTGYGFTRNDATIACVAIFCS